MTQDLQIGDKVQGTMDEETLLRLTSFSGVLILLVVLESFLAFLNGRAGEASRREP